MPCSLWYFCVDFSAFSSFIFFKVIYINKRWFEVFSVCLFTFCGKEKEEKIYVCWKLIRHQLIIICGHSVAFFSGFIRTNDINLADFFLTLLRFFFLTKAQFSLMSNNFFLTQSSFPNLLRLYVAKKVWKLEKTNTKKRLSIKKCKKRI